MGFQIILSTLIFLVIIRLCAQFYKGRIAAALFLFFLWIWGMSLILIWNIKFLNKIAHSLGLYQGVNILIYCGLFLLFYLAYLGVLKFYKLEQDINKLVRKSAIDDFLKRHKEKE